MRASTRLALPRAVMAPLWIALMTPLWIAGAHAEKKTICTITVNSADEKEAFRRHLPRERFDVVELVERGRPDWLRSACRKKISSQRAASTVSHISSTTSNKNARPERSSASASPT